MNIAIPQNLKHLKVDKRGYPIPFFVPIIKGEPNFRFLDERKQILCLEKKLCPICGTKLCKDYFYFISGPIGLKNCTASDPAMHKECAEFAMKVCPYMFFRKTDRKEHVPDDSVHIDEKPDHLFLIRSNKWKIIRIPTNGQRVIRFRVVDWVQYDYVNDRLTPKDLFSR